MTDPVSPSDSPQRYPEERRLATILFADIQGFTALADQIDFEEVGDLMREVWALVDAAIQKHGGYIDKHIGDAVMAVWGAPQAREDDAERAVSAALTLLRSVDAFAAQSNRDGVSQLKMRVGINTGQVLAGYVGARGEYTVMGDTVNIANRLETLAEPGTVLIGENTYRLVRGAFRMHRLEPLILKGKPQPIGAFVVEGAIEQSGQVRYRSLGGLETHMVGREAEMDHLKALYHEAVTDRTPVLVIVRGEAGLGKSRLLMEFVSALQGSRPDVQVLSSRGMAQTSRAPFFVWKSLWYNRFGINENDPPGTACEKFVCGVQAIWGALPDAAPAVEAAHFAGALIGLEWPDSPYVARLRHDPQAQMSRAYHLMSQILQRAAAAAPVVLVLDDLHDADSGSIDLLEYLLEPDSALPMLVVGATRPGLLRKYHELHRAAVVVPLRPLPIDPGLVARAYPSMAGLPESTRAEIVRLAEGNPYFMEEVVKGLTQSISIQGAAPDPLQVHNLAYKLPDTLHATLQARLDALSTAARSVALLASVVGRVFWVGAVTAAAQQTIARGTGLLNTPGARPIPDGVISDGLAELVRAELAFPRAGSMFLGEQEYIFKHSLMRDVAYSLLPHKYRRQYHLGVARWLATYATADLAATIAEHFEQAGMSADAAGQFEKAAVYARAHGALSEAEALEERARELMSGAARPPAAPGPAGSTGLLPGAS